MAPRYIDYVDTIKQTLDLREVVARYGLEPDRHGYVKCPFHAEKTGSMKVWPDHYKCFGCGAHGDVISFVQNYEHTEFAEALETLNRDFSLGLPFGGNETPLQLLRQRQKMQRDVDKARETLQLRELQAEQICHLTAVWAEYDSAIREHPVPDNERIAHAYQMRDYIGYLLDNADGELKDDEELQPARRVAG